MNLHEFIVESNKIDGILSVPTHIEIEAHERLLAQDELTVADIEKFVIDVANAPLRDKNRMNVIIGNHIPIGGGSLVKVMLEEILNLINKCEVSPYTAHHRYETLHPFMDGNGRSGRAIWLWHMAKRDDVDSLDVIYHRGFLHAWYYQSLSEVR